MFKNMYVRLPGASLYYNYILFIYTKYELLFEWLVEWLTTAHREPCRIITFHQKLWWAFTESQMLILILEPLRWAESQMRSHTLQLWCSTRSHTCWPACDQTDTPKNKVTSKRSTREGRWRVCRQNGTADIEKWSRPWVRRACLHTAATTRMTVYIMNAVNCRWEW